ncbi:GGDEF domain-containing protein [Chelativorans salis]|uniref:diguanylate cyclase n=1 Tax=Chelativorans salis TaxID=2978478 RepID=A0ABT2LTQ0_9HYPH|nr:GGDEF domain-containing protein [Chelativorans sp. EGI FJ00035]MCT7377444.1 GGDEF domain-containing protein [Chelativorans sp. EGI FJ00035]
MSRRGRIKLACWTILGTAGCIAVAVSINYALFLPYDEVVRKRAILSAVVIPILLAGPLFFYLTLKLRELAIVNYKLADAAATDFLTRCLNRGSFSARVEKWLVDGGHDQAVTGALLVIDADHFKKINDRFGHYEGDMALKAIAQAIRSAVRKTDFVGRLGGEEFGVFLPGATERGAASVAERIRQRVNRAAFNPGGESCPLSVSVGCATFAHRVGFSELFRVADERLYEAKNAGRNRIMLTRISFDQPQGAALH